MRPRKVVGLANRGDVIASKLSGASVVDWAWSRPSSVIPKKANPRRVEYLDGSVDLHGAVERPTGHGTEPCGRSLELHNRFVVDGRGEPTPWSLRMDERPTPQRPPEQERLMRGSTSTTITGTTGHRAPSTRPERTVNSPLVVSSAGPIPSRDSASADTSTTSAGIARKLVDRRSQVDTGRE